MDARDLQLVLLGEVAQLPQLGMAEERVVVERDLAVEGDDVAARGHDERIDLHERRVGGAEYGPGRLHHAHRARHEPRGQAQPERQPPRLEPRQTEAGIDGLAEDELRRIRGHLLYLHAARRARHDHGPLLRPVDQQAQVQLALDVQPLLHQHARNAAPLGTGLRRDEVAPDQRFRHPRGFFGAGHHLHAAALAPPAGVDLRLDHDAAAEPLRDLAGLDRGECDLPARHGQPVAGEQRLRLVFVDLHRVTRR